MQEIHPGGTGLPKARGALLEPVVMGQGPGPKPGPVTTGGNPRENPASVSAAGFKHMQMDANSNAHSTDVSAMQLLADTTNVQLLKLQSVFCLVVFFFKW